MVTFVDDCGIAYLHEKDVDKLINNLRNRGFALTREGDFTSFLGIKFEKDEETGSLTMTQKGLIDRIVALTGMSNCNPNWTPASSVVLASDPNGEPMTDDWNYRSVIGMFLYLSTNTRPDIAFAVSQVARFSNSPKASHATAVKTIIRYLVRTADKGTIVTPTGKLDFKLWVDADFMGLYNREPDTDPNSARSRTGYILTLGGFPLIWKSQLQTSIATDTACAEYQALSTALRAFIPIREVLFEIADIVSLPSSLTSTILCEVFEDNMATFYLANSQRLTSRTRWYHVKWHHFWEYVKLNEDSPRKVFVLKVSTDLQAGDMLTKPVPREVLERHRLFIQGW